MDIVTIAVLIMTLGVANSTGIIGRVIQFTGIYYLFTVIRDFIDTKDLFYLGFNLMMLSLLFLPFTLKYGVPLLFKLSSLGLSIMKKVVRAIGNTQQDREEETDTYKEPNNNNPYREEGKTNKHKKLLATLYDLEYYKQIKKTRT